MNSISIQQNLNHAQQLMMTGRLQEAEAVCNRILSANPNNPDSLSLLGVILSRSGKDDAAISFLEQASAAAPNNHVYLANLGAVYAANKDFTSAIAAFRKGISVKPSVAELHYNLGNAQKDIGDFESAVSSYRKATQLNPAYAHAWNNLGAVYIEQRKLDEALSAIKRGLSIAPNNPAAYNNLGNLYLLKGEIQQCISSCEHALALRPGYVDALRSLGAAFVSARNFSAAIACFEEIAAAKPGDVSALMELVNYRSLCHDLSGMADGLKCILEIEPDHSEALLMLGVTQLERGFTAESKELYKKALEVTGKFSVRVRHALALAPICDSITDIVQRRTSMLSNIQRLMNESGEIQNPYEEHIGPNFYLAFHALNDREIQMQIAKLYISACPSLHFEAAHCLATERRPGKIRIGFFSKFIFKHSVSVSFSQVVEQLSQHPNFEVYLISTTDHDSEEVKQLYKDFRGTFVCVPTNLQFARQLLASFALDILVYMDIGMDAFGHLLAFSRLAPAQCVLGGHPVTSGIPTLDYFLSPALAEAGNGQDHYSEKLVRLQSGGFSLAKPLATPAQKSKEALGLPAEGHIYLCPMMMQKLHPDFDSVLSQILERDPEGHVVLFESSLHPQWTVLLRARLARSLNPRVMDRIHFHSWMEDNRDFARAIELSDVVLDPIHFGIGTTAAHVFAVGTPIVTWPGEFMRGRVGFAFCQMLDVQECVALTRSEYVEKAVDVATNSALRQTIKLKILANNHRLFVNTSAEQELREIFERMVGLELSAT